jgi:hypothetical protein
MNEALIMMHQQQQMQAKDGANGDFNSDCYNEDELFNKARSKAVAANANNSSANNMAAGNSGLSNGNKYSDKSSVSRI